MSGPSQDVEVRLAEIDRRLREIQADLVPGRTPRETRMADAHEPPGRPDAHRPSHMADAHDPPDRPPDAPAPRVQPPSPEPDPAPPTPQPMSRPRGASSHGRQGPLAAALASARPRRARDTPKEPPKPQPPRPTEGALLTELESSLLAATRDLLDGYERAISSASQIGPLQVSLSAGPFSRTDALHAFERALARLPGVREVTVRGYDGPDHAILEVQLDRATPPRPST